MSTNTSAAKRYAKRDHEAQGAHYTSHVFAMTSEGLHAKSAIAAELAHRDIEIERLRAALGAAAQAVVPWDIDRTIACLLGDAMKQAVKNGANSVSMPDEYVALAAWLAGIPAQAVPAPGVPSTCQHRIVDARNPVIASGYLCVECGALFNAADHGVTAAPAQAGEYPELPEAMFAKDVASFDPVYLPDDMHAYVDADRAARGAAQAAPVSRDWFPVDGNTRGYKGDIVLRHYRQKDQYRLGHTNWIGTNEVMPYSPSGAAKPVSAWKGTKEGMGLDAWMPLGDFTAQAAPVDAVDAEKQALRKGLHDAAITTQQGEKT